MDENTTIEQLEELAEKFSVKIRYETIKEDEESAKIAGGLCLLRGEYVLIINSKVTVSDRIKTLGSALKHFDLEKIYIRPALRELLDRIPEQRPFKQER